MTSSDFRINKFYYNHRLSILFADSYEHIPSLALITYKDDTSKAVMAILAKCLRDRQRTTSPESFGGLRVGFRSRRIGSRYHQTGGETAT